MAPLAVPIPPPAQHKLPAWSRTWIEHWPDGLAELSFPQRVVPLTPAQAHALGRRNGVFASAFDASGDDKQALADLCVAIDRELALLGSAAFARLGSRSAKDTALGVLTGGRVDSGAATLRLLTDGSRRVGFDLRRALRHGFTPRIYLRQWREIPWCSEFRCFLQQGRLVGVSQYHACQPMRQDALEGLGRAHSAIQRLAKLITAAWGMDPVVADVIATDKGDATLIELNPWGPPTDAVLFSWEAGDFDGSLRVTRGGPPGDEWL